MKIKIGQLRSIIRESLMGDKYMSEDDAQQYIASMDGDAVTDVDIVDEETGEVYLQAGDDFRTSPWNPDHKVDKRRAEKDTKYAARAGEPMYCPDCDEEIKPGEEHTCEDPDDYFDRRDRERRAENERLENEYHAAVKEFAAQWTEFKLDMPDVAPEDAAYDAADSFFYSYPDWKKWAAALRMSKDTMKEVLADYVYDAMSTGRVPE